MTTEQQELIPVIFDAVLMRPACVILQAFGGCTTQQLHELGFCSEDWLIDPTPDMKLYKGTREQWATVVETIKMMKAHSKTGVVERP